VARLVRRASIAFAVLACLLVPSVAATAAAAESPAPQPASPADVEIPYLGDAAIEPSPPWQIADCAPAFAAGPIVTACDSSRISVAAPEYDPDAGTIVIRVPLTNGIVSTTVGYRVRLAAPETPTARPAELARPVAAGSLLRLPISELGLECVVCGDGGRLEAVEVEPATAGSVWATPTHLVFRAAANYAGPAEVRFRFADDYGAWSAVATVDAAVYRSTGAPLVTLDLVATAGADGTATVDLGALATSVGGDDVILVGCGAAVHGRVACDADAATYTGIPGSVDQFAVQFAAGGEQATASVTLIPEGSELVTPGPAAIAPPEQDGGVAVLLTPRIPVEHHETAGVFTPMVATLDRVGAR
jgi:hypothetical protein